MPLTLVTAPVLEPLTVAEVKTQLRLGTTAGEPAPTTPTVALVVAAGLITAGVHRWLWVYRTADGHTEAGAVSAPLTTIIATHGKATITKPLGGSAVTYCDLYRTAAGGSTYLLVVADLANDEATYTDNIADASLGAQAPTTNTTVDPELTRLITTARQRAEVATGRALITQTWQYVLDRFPSDSFIELPKPPLQSVSSVAYYDTSGTLQSPWAATNYDVQAPAGDRCARGRLALSYGITWPSTYGEIGDVTVQFVAGYGTARSTVPAMIRDAMLVCVEGLYTRDKDLQKIAHDLFWSYRSFPSQAVV